MRLRPTLLIMFLALIALLAPAAAPARAENLSARGYSWTLRHEFADSFDGKLTIMVGPVENGILLKVDETSTTSVPCKRVGPVGLVAGQAVFNGGYLRCHLDLAGALLANHGIVAPATDEYNSVTLSTQLASTALNQAPLFVHPDAAYMIDFTQSDSVTMRQWHQTTLGPALTQATFPGLDAATLREYGYLYGCMPAGPCAAKFGADPQSDVLPAVGGPVAFRTAPTAFTIGNSGGATFLGAMEFIQVDPGNTYPGAS